jgi:phosphoglycerate dehydrogenase-like enzyme
LKPFTENRIFDKGSELKIAITSTTFSKDPFLVSKIKNYPFEQICFNRDRYPLETEDLKAFLQNMDGAIIGRDRLNREVLDACPQLKAVSKFGVGLDNIDMGACEKARVRVLYSRGVNRRSVAEQTLGFMIFLMRNLYQTSIQLKSMQWQKEGGRQLSEKKIGVIGVGHIGKDIIELLQPFGCEIYVNDIVNQDQYYKRLNLLKATKARIFKECDLITIHTPLTPKTRHMVRRKNLEMMKKSAFLINTARGAIVEKDDLEWALRNNIIAGAAVDVYETEPPQDRSFLQLPNLICTPHIGGNALEAVRSMGSHAIENLAEFFFSETYAQ